MVEDPDAMWKPGPTAPASDRGEPDAEPDPSAVGRGELPDRFRPATGARGVQRVHSAPADDSSATATLADPPETEMPQIVAAGWTVDRDEPARAPRSRRRLSPRAIASIVAVVGVAVAAVVVVSVMGGDRSPTRPGPGELPSADERRLPAEVDELWATTLSGSGNALASSVIVDGRDLVVAVVDDGSRNRSMIVGVDATSGVQRWRRSFSFAPPEVSMLGVFEGVVVIEQNDLSGRELIGLSTVDGATVWERETAEGGANTVLLGTDLVTHLSSTVAGLITFVDPRTGEVVGEVVGELLSTDLAGTWYLVSDGEVVSIDLSDGWSEPVDSAAVGAPPGDVMAVVDGRLLVADASGQVSELTDAGTGSLDGADIPSVVSMFPAGGSSFVGLNNGEVFGVELVGDTVGTTWRRTASLRGFALTERGLVLSISDAGAGFADGVDLMVVDGITGERLAGAGAVNDLDSLPLIVGDGFVTVLEGVDGTERVGYDLDGDEMWRLSVSGKVRVGDGLVVVMTNTPAGYELRAYGSAE